jgi:hypothetical protein
MESNALLKQRKGLALMSVLLLLLVLTVTASTVFLMTGADLRTAVHGQQNLAALYAAEAGVHSLLAAYRESPQAFFGKKNGPPLNPPASEAGPANWEAFRVWLTELQYDPDPFPRYVELTVRSREPLSRASALVKAVIVHNQLPAPFQLGLVTAGSLEAAGVQNLQTGLHANQGYSLDPDLAAALRSRQYPLSQSLDPAGADYRPPLTAPFLSPTDVAYYRSLARQGNNVFWDGNQTLHLSGDQQGRLIFVEGDLKIEGIDLTGVTLVASGEITFSGNAPLNSRQQIDTALITAKDLVLKNEGEVCGVFWSGGSLIPAGSAGLQGMVISQGPIRADPAFRFRRNEAVQNPYLPPPSAGPRFVLKGWLQL